MVGKPQRIAAIWNWLPVFRVVAETEHLPTASELLHVSGSALSRTVKLLEEEIGEPLFDREGRNIVLNDAGKMLLHAVRHAMRMTDEGVERALEQANAGNVKVAIPGPYVPVLLHPALRVLKQDFPRLVPNIVSIGNNLQRLLSGEVDIAVVEHAEESDQVQIERLTQMKHQLFARREHPLHLIDGLTTDMLAEADFVAPVPMPSGETPDEWPNEWRRRIAVRVSAMQVAIDLAGIDDLLVVLPDAVGKRAGLVALPIDLQRFTTIYSIRRRALPMPTKADRLADALRKVVGASNETC